MSTQAVPVSITQTGVAQVGSLPGQQGSAKNITVSFPKAFSSAPVVVANALDQANTNFPDVFAVTIVSVSTTQFVARILRVDAQPGWGQNLQLGWIAIGS